MLEYGSLVYGGSLDALTFALHNGYPILYVAPLPAHRFRCDGEARKQWFVTHLSLGILGLLPFSTKAQSARIDGNSIMVTTRDSRTFKISFDMLHLFDDCGLEGLPIPSGRTDQMYEVLDWVNVRSGAVHGVDQLKPVSPIIKCIHFYPSDRISGNHNKKDACVISHLTTEQLADFNYSELVTRIKLAEYMENEGIKGTGNGVGKHLPIKLESSRREVFPLGKNIYEDEPHIKFIYSAGT